MAVANLCPLRDLSESRELDRGDNERRQRERRNGGEVSGNGLGWRDADDTEDDEDEDGDEELAEEGGTPEEPPMAGQGSEHGNELNFGNFPDLSNDDYDDDDYNDSISIYSDYGNSYATSSPDYNDYTDGGYDENVVFSPTDGAASGGRDDDADDHLSDEDNQNTESCLKLEELDSEKIEEGEEGDNLEDDSETLSETSDEDYEEFPEKLYSHPSYPKKVFQALEAMEKSSFLTDLSLTTPCGFKIRVHSLVLAAVSAVVQQMILERDGKSRKETTMFLSFGQEVTGVALSAVLEFAYTGTITGLNRFTLAHVRAAALSLGVPRVLELCKEEEDRERKRGGKRKMEEKKSRISAEEQLKISLGSIRRLWEERVGCDLELEAEGHIFRVHKVLLIAGSDYFRGMFCHGMKESQQTSVTLFLIGALELGMLLECIYSGALALDWGCVFELTCTAIQFQFQPALSLCLAFMEEEVDAQNCLDVAAFAEAYRIRDLQDIAEDFVLRHFKDVAASPKFLDLPAEKLKMYLRSNSLCVASELPVLKAVVAWIGFNPRRRVREARELLATIKFPLMTFKEFKEVKAITAWPKMSNEDLYDSLLEEFCVGNSTVLSNYRTYLPKEVLVLVGGERITENLDKRIPCRDLWFSNSFRNHVAMLKRVEWRMLGDLPEKPRFSHSVGVIRGKLYIVGGRHYYGKSDTMKSTYRYDPMQNSWIRLADMNERRGSFALVVLDDKLYAMGGNVDAELNTETVEVYFPDTDSWSFVHPLDQTLSGHAASVWNGNIYISGGFDCTYQCLVSMLQYHPEKGTVYLQDMYLNHAQHCMETFQDRLYVAGGVSSYGGGLVDQLDCEFYDPVRDAWGVFMPMSVPHVAAASAVLEGKIYILGGYCQEDYSDTKRVHRYDPVMHCWENLCGTPGPTTYMAACVLPVPGHLRQL
ncbi:kelch-like protein 33 isoform X1 [Astyanax mexicanus]|uniref:kelch-like protein 33 isoform X1 n=1 Tax=Astyanax mexicanus TaxID=7994 RepID=UPI0020CB581A|nr:kelch-like protein 33 isoform X1 [Astyanax mexicanus]